MKNVIFVFLVISFVLSPILVSGHGDSDPMMANMMGGGSFLGGYETMGWFGWIFMLLFWVLIIAGIVALIKWIMTQSGGSYEHKNSPLEILKERYVKGEISKKEFEEKKKDLI